MNEELRDEIIELYSWLQKLENGEFDANYNCKSPEIIEEIKNYMKGIFLGIPVKSSPSSYQKIPPPENTEEFVLFLVSLFHDTWLYMYASESLEEKIHEYLSTYEVPIFWNNELLFLLFLLKYNRGLKSKQLLSVLELKITEHEANIMNIDVFYPSVANEWRTSLLELIIAWLSEDEFAGQNTLASLEEGINKGVPFLSLIVALNILFDYAVSSGDFILAQDLLFIAKNILENKSDAWKNWYEKNSLILGLILGKETSIKLEKSPLDYYNKRDFILNMRMVIINEVFNLNVPPESRNINLEESFKDLEIQTYSVVEEKYLLIMNGFSLSQKGYVDQAILKITDAFFTLENIKDYSCYFLIVILADLSLLYYAAVGAVGWLQRAENFMKLNEEFIDLTFSPLLAITTYIQKSVLELAKGNLEESLLWVERGRSVTKQYGHMKYALWIQKIYDFIMNTKNTIRQSLKQLLQGRQSDEIIPVIPVLSSSITNKNDFALIFYAFQETGPTPVWAVDGEHVKVENDEVLLLRMGTYLYVLIGQGHNYPEGLYGPLPTTDHPELECFVLSKMIYDPVQKDPRLREQNYIILTIIVPKGKAFSPIPREYLFKELSVFIEENPSIIISSPEKFSTRFRDLIEALNHQYFKILDDVTSKIEISKEE